MFLTIPDVQVFDPQIDPAKCAQMIQDLTSRAIMAAPGLDSDDLTDVQRNAVKGILRTALLRWNDAGTGARTTRSVSHTTGPYGQTDSTTYEPLAAKSRLWPSEIEELRNIVKDAVPQKGKAFSINMIPVPTTKPLFPLEW